MQHINTIIHGNAETIAPTLPEQSVHTIVTSPPYYGLRDYGNTEQIGLEETPTAYINRLVGVFQSLRPCLRDDGTLWVNLGDTYSAHKDCKGISQSLAVGTSREDAHKLEKGLSRSHDSKMLKQQGLKNKDLIGIPWMFAFAMREAGWYLRQDIIWAKKNCMPESVKDRCTKAHEYIFLFSKQQKYYYDYQAIQERADYDGRQNLQHKGSDKYNTDYSVSTLPTMVTKGGTRWKTRAKFGNRDGALNGVHSGNNWEARTNEEQEFIRNKRSVWHVETQPFKEAHFATFPPKLITPCILAGSPEQGVVLDPFMGSGTTALVALRNNRNFIGIELNQQYIDIAYNRINHVLHQERLAV